MIKSMRRKRTYSTLTETGVLLLPLRLPWITNGAVQTGNSPSHLLSSPGGGVRVGERGWGFLRVGREGLRVLRVERGGGGVRVEREGVGAVRLERGAGCGEGGREGWGW